MYRIAAGGNNGFTISYESKTAFKLPTSCTMIDNDDDSNGQTKQKMNDRRQPLKVPVLSKNNLRSGVCRKKLEVFVAMACT